MKLYDIAKVIRSKNAGPFTLTLDLIFKNNEDYQQIIGSPAFNENLIADLYGATPESVKIHPFERVLAIKVSMPRKISSGAPNDCDVYGSQQHFPLGTLEIT